MACRALKVIRARRAVAAKAVLFVGLAAELARRVARNEAVLGVARRALVVLWFEVHQNWRDSSEHVLLAYALCVHLTRSLQPVATVTDRRLQMIWKVSWARESLMTILRIDVVNARRAQRTISHCIQGTPIMRDCVT